MLCCDVHRRDRLMGGVEEEKIVVLLEKYGNGKENEEKHNEVVADVMAA